jgi:uncharacterized protein
MSQENAEIVRAMYEAFDHGDVLAAWDMMHPDAELHQPPEVPDTDSYFGRGEWARGFALWLSEFDEPRFTPQEITEVEGCVIMHVRVSGKGKASGLVTEADFFHAWTLRDGRPYQCFVRSTRAQALKAVGLEE